MIDSVTIDSVGALRHRYLGRFHDNNVPSENNPMSLIVVQQWRSTEGARALVTCKPMQHCARSSWEGSQMTQVV